MAQLVTVFDYALPPHRRKWIYLAHANHEDGSSESRLRGTL